MSTQELIKEQKSTLWLLKKLNLIIDIPEFRNSVIFKAVFKLHLQPQKDEFIKAIEQRKFLYKEFDEIDEQLDEERREKKNLLGEVIENATLFLEKINEYEEGEKEEELKNAIKEVLQSVDKRQKIRKFLF